MNSLEHRLAILVGFAHSFTIVCVVLTSVEAISSTPIVQQRFSISRSLWSTRNNSWYLYLTIGRVHSLMVLQVVQVLQWRVRV